MKASGWGLGNIDSQIWITSVHIRNEASRYKSFNSVTSEAVFFPDKFVNIDKAVRITSRMQGNLLAHINHFTLIPPKCVNI